MQKKSTTNSLDLTVIIVSYNTAKITKKCLSHLKTARQYAQKALKNSITPIVVDNDSTDNTANVIKNDFPEVILFQFKKNVGFAKANNLGMQHAKSPFILLLNSDAFVKKDTLVKSLQYMQSNPKIDCLCVQLQYPDGTFQPVGGHFPTPAKTILWALGFESMPLIKNLIKPMHAYNPTFYKQARQMEWCSSAFFLIKREVFEKTKGYDERMFLYFEDVEWCQRIAKKHFLIYFTPDISIIHQSGASSKKLSRHELQRRHLEGIRHFHTVHYPKQLKLTSTFLTIGTKLRSIFYALSKIA